MTMLQDEPTTAGKIREERNMAAFYKHSERADLTQTIGPESKGEWYLIRCEPGRDLTAMAWLSGRRFGVFLAMNGLKRVLPGWLCAYVFGMDEHRDRILAAPGVVGMLRCHKKLPLVIDMAFIQRLAKEAWTGRALPPARKKPTKRLKPRDRKAHRKAKKAAKRAKLARKLDVAAQVVAYRNS